MATTHAAKPVLTALMERNGWDPQDMAVHGGVPIDTLRKWLGGTNNPTVRRLSEVVSRAGGDPTEFGLRPVASPGGAASTSLDTQMRHDVAMMAARIEAMDRNVLALCVKFGVETTTATIPEIIT